MDTFTNIEFSFYLTFVFLTTTATITFIEALCTKDETVRHILNLETAISVIAAFFYNTFITEILEKKKQNKPVDWDRMLLTRYIDWSLTTPFMLLSLCLFLSYNSNIKLRLLLIITVCILNYIMLYIGYLGETNVMNRMTACVLGFIPLFLMMWMIYKTFIAKCKQAINIVLFYTFLGIWAMYGVAYMFDSETKNIIMNVLDLIAKAIVGILMWLYYINVIHL